MITKIIIALAAFVGFMFVPATANAGDCTLASQDVCGQVRHYSPDDGYDAAIIISCNWIGSDDTHYLTEGQNSTYYCRDVDRIYIRTNEELWCKMYNPIGGGSATWVKRMDSAGWHTINDLWDDGAGCTLRRD